MLNLTVIGVLANWKSSICLNSKLPLATKPSQLIVQLERFGNDEVNQALKDDVIWNKSVDVSKEQFLDAPKGILDEPLK